MRKVLVFCIWILFTGKILFGQVQFYNTSTMNVGPGVVHKKYIAPEKPWTLNVLEIDLTNPFVTIETMKANNRLASRERTSSMAARTSYDQHQVVGAINGDFYDGSGIPIGTQVWNGRMLKMPIGRSVIGINAENLPQTDVVSFSGRIFTSNLFSAIHRINASRGSDQLVVYNRFFGLSTETNQYGTEVLLTPASDWIVNDTIHCVVDTVVTGVGSMSIPSGKIVLSGHGTSQTFLDNHIQQGDSIRLVLSLLPGLERLNQVVGGFPKIVKNGQNYALQGYAEEGGSGSFATARHPRTAAGFSADSTVLYLVTIDGRQSISIGMNLVELAGFMVDIGVENGINLDGGGSTTIVVRGNIENSPSDGTERAVSNALAAISGAPFDSLDNIQIKPDNYRVLIGKSLAFKTSGWDQYYNPKSLINQNLNYQVSSSMGIVDNSGLFTAGWSIDSGYVIVTYEELIDSAYVYVKGLNQIQISPKQVTTDTIETVRFRMSATDVDKLPASFPNTDYQWRSLNPEIGEIDSTGIFQGLREGTVRVVVSIAGLTDTAIVKVEIVTGTAVIDSMDALTNWSVTGILYDPVGTQLSVVDTPKTIGSGSIKLNYNFTRSAEGRTYINLDSDIQIFGLPDTILLDVKSDGEEHWVFFIISDDDGELFRGSTGKFADQAKSFDTLKVAMDKFNAINPPADFNFPIRFTTIETRMGFSTVVGELNSGYIYFDNLRLIYPGMISSIPLHNSLMPSKATLYQNYPNPFNSATTIKFATDTNGRVKLTVYDVTGRKVENLLNQNISAGYHEINWETNSIASGVYFYKLQTNDYYGVKKMILIR